MKVMGINGDCGLSADRKVQRGHVVAVFEEDGDGSGRGFRRHGPQLAAGHSLTFGDDRQDANDFRFENASWIGAKCDFRL